MNPPISDSYGWSNSYFSPYSYSPFRPSAVRPVYDDEPPSTTLPGGTLLHQGFYDLLSMIPTPSPSRLLWGNQEPAVVAGPRYEDLPPSRANLVQNVPPPAMVPPVSPSSSPKKGRRISKDMVSKPTGFVCVSSATFCLSFCLSDSDSSHLVHASTADQAEALLTRWGPDGLGKLGGQDCKCLNLIVVTYGELDPRWANPIIERLRQKNQERAINEVVNALKPSQSSILEGGGEPGPLRVVNGMSTNTSSALTTAAQENFMGTSTLDGLPGRRNSTIRWAGVGLKAHPEVPQEHEEDSNPSLEKTDFQPLPPPPRKPIIPSLSTLEKAVSARIYFENIYFPLLRHTPSREQRRVAMETDMMSMQLSEAQKENLRARWRQNETDYLRDRRRKVDASAFVKLKTIGHGTLISPYWYHLSRMNQISMMADSFPFTSAI